MTTRHPAYPVDPKSDPSTYLGTEPASLPAGQGTTALFSSRLLSSPIDLGPRSWSCLLVLTLPTTTTSTTFFYYLLPLRRPPRKAACLLLLPRCILGTSPVVSPTLSSPLLLFTLWSSLHRASEAILAPSHISNPPTQPPPLNTALSLSSNNHRRSWYRACRLPPQSLSSFPAPTRPPRLSRVACPRRVTRPLALSDILPSSPIKDKGTCSLSAAGHH